MGSKFAVELLTSLERPENSEMAEAARPDADVCQRNRGYRCLAAWQLPGVRSAFADMSYSHYGGQYGHTKGDVGFYMGSILWPLLIWDPCPFGFPEILTAAHMLTFAKLLHEVTSSAATSSARRIWEPCSSCSWAGAPDLAWLLQCLLGQQTSDGFNKHGGPTMNTNMLGSSL